MTQYDVFLSHRSTDKAWVRILCANLRLAGYRVFLDEDELPPGASLPTAIHEALHSSSKAILVVTPDVYKSFWVKKELEQIVYRQINDPSYVFVPVLLQGEMLSDFPLIDGILYADFRVSTREEYADSLHRLICGLEKNPPTGTPLPTFPIKFPPNLVTPPIPTSISKLKEEILWCIDRNPLVGALERRLRKFKAENTGGPLVCLIPGDLSADPGCLAWRFANDIYPMVVHGQTSHHIKPCNVDIIHRDIFTELCRCDNSIRDNATLCEAVRKNSRMTVIWSHIDHSHADPEGMETISQWLSLWKDVLPDLGSTIVVIVLFFEEKNELSTVPRKVGGFNDLLKIFRKAPNPVGIQEIGAIVTKHLSEERLLIMPAMKEIVPWDVQLWLERSVDKSHHSRIMQDLNAWKDITMMNFLFTFGARWTE